MLNRRTNLLLIMVISLVVAGCFSVNTADSVTQLPSEPSSDIDNQATATPFMTATVWPPHTATPYPMITRTPASSSADLENIPGRMTDDHGVAMVLIPEGEFIMGSEAGFPDEVPVHEVWVDTFYIDLTEVTNRQYQNCVEAGICQPPRRADCCTEDPARIPIWSNYFGNPEFDNHPVIFISWYDAYTFCTDWRGARLATEAEWEKASRGTDGRIYPWGNEEPTPDLINFLWPEGTFDQRPLYTTSPVGTYPLGASPYGVLDLAGNVYEWLWDRYAPDYFEYSPYENPTGPEEGVFRLTRGGSFWNQAFRNRSANRNNAYIPATSVHFDGGARCARDVPGSERIFPTPEAQP